MRTMKLFLALLVLAAYVPAFAENLIEIDVSGRKGDDGEDGTDRTGTASRATKGADGGDAGPAEAGQHSGNISIRLRSGSEGKLILDGSYEPAGEQRRSIERSLSIGTQGYIPLKANGGEGGRGGDGGQGQKGGKGHDGSDATRFSWGTSGDPGKQGGSGGKATSGKNGGDGGKIHVRVSEEDTHLLMLALPQFKGGKPGRAGKNGKGGEGGDGGDGGSSYSWTEHHTRTVTKSDGSTGTESYTTFHTNPGGSDGPRGPDGPDGAARVKAGDKGEDGEYKIIVGERGRTREYTHRYDMEIIDFEIHNDNNDGIFEPGEKATIVNLAVKNTGGMPTPPNHPVTIFLATSEWVLPEPVQLKVPKSLAPGESYIFKEEVLPFQIPDTRIVSQDAPFVQSDRARPQAYQATVNRPFTNFEQPHDFTIQFPIKIEPIQAVETLARGDMTRLDWKVTNISGRDFGGASELKREIAAVLGMANKEEMGGSVVLMDTDGKPLDWEKGLLQEVSNLKAGESAVLKGMVGILPTSEAYASANLHVDLQLGRIDKPSDRKLIQQNNYPIRVGERYAKTENSDILLVTNHGTTQDEIEAWRALALRSGKKLDVWDVSLNNYLDLDRSISKGANLLQDFHGKTIVVLNNKFKSVEGEKHGDELMGQMDLIRATASHGARILVVNESRHDVDGLMSDRLIPTDLEVEYGYASLDSYLQGEPQVRSEVGDAVEMDRLFREQANTPEARRAQVKVNPTQTTGQIPVVGYLSPSAERLKAQAEEAQRLSEARNPGARVVVTYEVAKEGQAIPSYGVQKGWFGAYRLQGMLTVRPTVNAMQPNILVLDVGSSKIHEPSFINSNRMGAALMQAYNFEDKLSALDKVLGELSEMQAEDPRFQDTFAFAGKLVDGILIDITVEQAAVLSHGWKSGLSGKTLTDSMAYLNRLATYQSSLDLSKPSAASVVMSELVGGLQFLARNQARWYERLPMPWAPFRRGPVVARHTRAMALQVATHMFGPPASHSEDLKKKLRERIEFLTKRRNELYEAKDAKLTLKNAAVYAVMDPLLGEDVTMDAVYTFNRVLSQSDWWSVHESEVRVENERREYQMAKEEQKGDFLIVDNGQVTKPEYASCAAHFLAAARAPLAPATVQAAAPGVETQDAPQARPAF